MSKVRSRILNITYDPIVLHEIHGFSDASLEGYGFMCIFENNWENNPRAFGNFVVIAIRFCYEKSFASHYNGIWNTSFDGQFSLFKLDQKHKNGINNVVQYRVNGGRGNSLMNDSHFCKTIDDPAEYVTRQLKLPSDFFISTAWLKGPKFLQERHFARFSDWFICWRRSSTWIKDLPDFVIKHSPTYQMLTIWTNVQNFFI